MHVIVNAAMSADGKLASHQREQLRISGEEDFARVDRLRAQSDAIMVGIGTVLADDPSLTRFDRDHRTKRGVPARVVVDSEGRTPPEAALFESDGPLFVLTTNRASYDRLSALRAAGATVINAGTDRVALPQALSELESAGIERLLVEGGGELIFSLFEANLVDELSLYVGAFLIGGRDAPTLADGEGFVDSFPELVLSDIERLDDGVLLRWTVS